MHTTLRLRGNGCILAYFPKNRSRIRYEFYFVICLCCQADTHSLLSELGTIPLSSFVDPLDLEEEGGAGNDSTKFS